MAGNRLVHLYCEDRGHEEFARALLGRLAREVGVSVQVETKSGRGGYGRAVEEFKAWQRAVVRDQITGIPDLLVVIIDTNCSSWNTARTNIESSVQDGVFPAVVVGCPDPQERWCIADPQAFREVVGRGPLTDPGKCERSVYKALLRDSIREADQPIITSEMEYAPDIVAAMDLGRAGKAQSSLHHFVDDLRTAITGLAR